MAVVKAFGLAALLSVISIMVAHGNGDMPTMELTTPTVTL
jgi:hypothetical protein